MATKEESAKLELLRMIQSFYDFAAVDLRIHDVNDGVAEAFFEMLEATAKCSKAFVFVPQPTGGLPGVLYFMDYIRGSVFNSYMRKFSLTCARGVALKYRTKIQLASMGT